MRSQLIEIIRGHNTVASKCSVENLADDIMAVCMAEYEEMKKEIAISRIERKARGL